MVYLGGAVLAGIMKVIFSPLCFRFAFLYMHSHVEVLGAEQRIEKKKNARNEITEYCFCIIILCPANILC